MAKIEDISSQYEERKKTQRYLDNFVISLHEITDEFKETQQTLSSAIEKLEALEKAHSALAADDTAAKKERSQIVDILKEAKTENTLPAPIASLIEKFTLDIASIDYDTQPSNLIKPDARDAILQNDAENTYRLKQQWESQVSKILERKNLSPTLFAPENKMSIERPIKDHAAWAFKLIYNMPYAPPARPNAPLARQNVPPNAPARPNRNPMARQFRIPTQNKNPIANQPPPMATKNKNTIARLTHGIQHVAREALYIPVFANLYRKHSDPESQKLTEADIKLLQIAVLFNSSAREGAGEDKWHHESATLLYFHLTHTLGVDQDKAKLITEAVANKDPNKAGYFSIVDSDTTTWKWNEARDEKNIYQKLIHDASCLDIIRSQDTFDATHLDFHKEFQANPLAVEEMAKLITESRSLIDIEGDTHNLTKPEIKKRYESENAYLETRNALDKRHPLLVKLSQKLYTPEELQKTNLVDTVHHDPQAGLTEENMQAAIREGRVFSRGVSSPSAITKKELKDLRSEETFAETEIRKTLRRTGISTRTSKEDNLEKEGNPNRSVSMIGYGSPVFCNAGFFIVNPALDDIKTIDKTDAGTGRFKKERLQKDLPDEKLPSNDEKTKKLEELHERLKLGGASVTLANNAEKSGVSRHNEILYHLKDYDAIYFSNDPNLFNADMYGSQEITHTYAPLLEAIFLKNEYEKASQKNLPVFEYSSTHNTVRKVPEEELTHENIKKMWVCMSSDFINNAIHKDTDSLRKILSMPIEEIKTLSMYRVMYNKYGKENASADSNYEKTFQDEISKAIQEERAKLISEYGTTIKSEIKKGELSPLSDKASLVLSSNPALVEDLRTEITQAIQSFDVKQSFEEKTSQLATAYTFAKQLNLTEETEKMRAVVSDLISDKIAKLGKDSFAVRFFLKDELFKLLSDYEILENNPNIKIEIEKTAATFLKEEKTNLLSELAADFKENAQSNSVYFLEKYKDHTQLIKNLSDKEMLGPEQKEEAREFLSKVKEELETWLAHGSMPKEASDLLKKTDDLSQSLDLSAHNRPSI